MEEKNNSNIYERQNQKNYNLEIKEEDINEFKKIIMEEKERYIKRN